MNITGQQIPLEVSSEHSKSTPFQSFRGDKPRVSYGGGFHISKKPATAPQAYIPETSQPGEISNRFAGNSSIPPLHVIEMELERLKQQSMSIQALRNKQTTETILHLDPPSHRHKHEDQPVFSRKNFSLQELEVLKEENAGKIIEIEAELRRSKEPEVKSKHSEFVPVYYKREKSPKRPEKLTGVQKDYYEKFEKFVHGKEKKKVDKIIEGKGTQESIEKNFEVLKSGKSTGDFRPKPILKTSSSAKSLKIEKNEQPTCLIPYKHMSKLEEVFLKVDEHQDFVVPRGELIESMLEDEHIIKILHLDAVRVTPYQVLDLESMLLYIKSDSSSPEDLLTWNQFLDYFFIAPTFEDSHYEGMENPKMNEIDLPSRFMALIQEVFEDIPKKSHDKVSTYEFIQSIKDDTKTSALMNYTARIPENLSHIPEETVQEVLQRMEEMADSLISWVEILGFFSKRGLPKDSNIGQSLITRNSFVKAKMPAKPVKENFVQTEDVELKKHSNRSRSISPRGKVTFYENSFTKDVTVPAPFKFEEREKDKRKTIREKWLEREEKEREEELKKHINFQYRAREVPREVIQPKFEGLKKALEERSAQVKRESAEKTKQLEKPFNFYLREKEKVKKEPPPPPEYSFKATPIPWACTVTLYESKMKEDDALREERKSRAAQENLRKASLPPRMEMYQSIKKVEIVENNTPSPKIKVKEPPNFEKLHERFAKTLEAKKKAKQTITPKPFLIDQRVEENNKKKEEKRMKKEEERKNKEEEDRKRKERERNEMVKAKTNWKNEHDSIKQRTGRTENKKSLGKSKSKSRSRETSPANSKLKGFTSKDLQKDVTMDVLKPPTNSKKPSSPIKQKNSSIKSSKPSLAPPKPSGFTEKDLNPPKSSGFTEKDLNPSKPSGFTEKDLNQPKSGTSGKNSAVSSSLLAPDKPKTSNNLSKNQPSSGAKPSSNPLAPENSSSNPLAPANPLAPGNSSSNPLAPSPSTHSSGSKFDPLGKKPAVPSTPNPLAPSEPSSNLLAPPGQSSNPLAPSFHSSNDFSLPPSNYSDLKPIPEESKHPLSPKSVGPSKVIANKNTKTLENSKNNKDKKYNTLNPLKKVIADEEKQAAGGKSGINEKLQKRKEDAKQQELEYQEKLRAIKENVNKRPLLVETATDSSNKNRSKMKILLSIKKNLEDNGVKYEPYFTEEELTLIQEAEYMTFFGISQASLVFESKTDFIDPGRILWPQSSWVNNPIDFSLNHAGENVSAYISFSVTNAIQNGVVEIHFPSGFDLTDSPYYQDDKTLIFPISIPDPTQTVKLTLHRITLPSSPGSYGPFGIYTRHLQTGQIVDMNKLFCSVGIWKPNLPPPSDSLTITFSDVNMDTVKAKSSILFTFELTQDLWKFDYFVITIPQVFSILNPVCRSETVKQNANFLQTEANDIREFGCSNELGKLFIYGLSADIDISLASDTGSLTISFSVTGFTNPEADYSIDTYEWSLDIYRYSSNSIVQSFYGQGPETYPGIVSVNSWQPHNKFDTKKIVSGIVLFMDLSFTPDHQIPATGKFEIELNGVDLTSKVWKSDEDQSLTTGDSSYYFVDPYIGGSCALDSTKITCSGFSTNINARNTITVSLLVEFLSTSAGVQGITTYLNDEVIIDWSDEYPLSINYASTVELLTDYTLFFSSSLDTSSSNRVCNTGGGLYYIVLYFQIPVDLSTDSKVNVYLPLSKNQVGEFSINLDNTLTGVYTTGSTLDSNLTSGTPLVGVSVSSLGVTFSLTATASDYISIALFKDDGSGSPSQMNLPYVASNKWTRYESRIELTISNIFYTYSAPFTILPDSPLISFDLLCTDSGKAGLPARITGNMNFDYSSLYYIYIDIVFSAGFATDLGSGLSDGEDYPFDTDSVSSIPKSSKMTLSHGSGPTLTISGLSSILQTSVLRAFFPIGSLTAGSYSVTISLYTLKKDRSDVHFEVFSKTISRTVASNTKNWQTATSSTTSSQIDTFLDTSSETGYDLTLRSATSASNTVGYIGIILPKGFTVADPTVTDGSLFLSNPLSFSSPNNKFAFPGILVQETSSLSLSTSSSLTLHFTGIKTVGYFTSSSPSSTITPYEGVNTWNSACESITGTLPSLTLTRGILSPNFSPSKVVGRGPQSVQQALTINFNTISFVPKLSYIEIGIDSEWGVTSNTYIKVKGIEEYIISTSTPYRLSGLSEIESGTEIEITIYNLMPPLNSGTTVVSTGCVDYLSIYIETGELIDSWIDNTDSSSPDSCVIVNPQYTTGKPVYESVSAFPNTASTDGVSLLIEFSLENALPPYSSITIKSPTTSWAQNGDIRDKCWFSLKYSSCTVSGNSLTIVTDEEYTNESLKLLIDEIIDTPLSINDELSVSISTTFNGVSIDQDGDASGNSILVLVNPPTEIFTEIGEGVKIEPKNVGVEATYTFLFSINTDIVKNDKILIKFPEDYDPYLGQSEVKFSWGEPNNYYIDCSSEVLGNINCKIDHWFLIVSGLNTVLADTEISLTIQKVSNPSSLSTQYFKFYLLDSEKSIKAFKSDFSSPSLMSSPDSNIKIRSITTSNQYLKELSDYNFTFYLHSITFSLDDLLLIKFPVQYTLDWDLLYNSVLCESFHVDESLNSVSLDSKKWDSTSNCSYLGSNVFAMNMSQIGSWTSSDRISIILKGIYNPEWGFSREEYYDGQSNQYFAGYTEWTGEFEIGALGSGSGYLIGKSFSNVNPAFLGFKRFGSKITVGGYDPMFKNTHLLIVPGTQSQDLSINVSENWGLEAKKVVFKPKNHSKNQVNLKFVSAVQGFFILQGEKNIQFKMSTEIGGSNGLVYIEWDSDEYSLIGLTQPAYSKPCKTLVEVYSGFIYKLTSIPPLDVVQGTESIPILISSPVPPESNFTVALSFEDASLNGIEINPISLTFHSETTKMFFRIIVSSSFNGKINTLYSVKFGLTGPNYSVFEVPEFQFKVIASQTSSPISAALSISKITATSADIYIKTSSTSAFYWQLLPYGTDILTYIDLKSLTKPLVSEKSQGLTLFDQIKTFHSTQEIEPEVNETWSDYQKRSYSSSLTQVWYDITYAQGEKQTLILSPTWLWAETEYVLAGYLENDPYTLYNLSFTTSDLPESVKLELLFSDIVVESKAYPLTTIVAYNLAVPEKQLESLQTLGHRQLIDTTLFSWVFYPNRAWNISPLELFYEVDQVKLALDVANSGISNTIISFSASVISRDSYQSPYWTNSGYPELVNVSESSVIISLKSAVTGTMCCVAEEYLLNSSSSPFIHPVSPTQILLILNSHNQNTSGACISNSATNFNNIHLTIRNLNPLTNYTATCSAYNTYPLWPVSSPYSDSLNLPSFDFLTLNSSNDESSNSYSMPKLVLGLYFNLIIFL